MALHHIRSLYIVHFSAVVPFTPAELHQNAFKKPFPSHRLGKMTIVKNGKRGDLNMWAVSSPVYGAGRLVRFSNPLLGSQLELELELESVGESDYRAPGLPARHITVQSSAGSFAVELCCDKIIVNQFPSVGD